MRRGLKRVVLLFLGLSIATFVGSASAQTAPNLEGTWTGGAARGATTMTLVLKQTGTNVSGTLSGAGADVDGPVEGTVEGNTLKLKQRSGFASAPLLNVKGDQMSGILGGGTVTLTRAKK